MKETIKNRLLYPDMSGLSLYQRLEALFYLFLTGAVGGFLYEEIYCLIINTWLEGMPFPWRGFLYGPYLPLYGFGVLILYFLFHRLRKYPLIVFFGTILVTGVLEYICGWAFLTFAGYRLWDYSGRFMNFGGHVSLQTLLIFGVLSLVSAYVAQPLVFRAYLKSSPKKRTVIAAVCLGILLIDLVITLIFPNTLGRA